jgi:hypothetical protein
MHPLGEARRPGRRREESMDNEETRDLETSLGDQALTSGQRRRLGIFHAVETGVSTRIETFCEETGTEVVDVAVLIIAPAAHGVFFGANKERGTAVILGDRVRLHAFLETVLPKAPGAPFDPYADLLEPAPVRCVRVLIIDDESLTVLSYGSFITVELNAKPAAMA